MAKVHLTHINHIFFLFFVDCYLCCYCCYCCCCFFTSAFSMMMIFNTNIFCHELLSLRRVHFVLQSKYLRLCNFVHNITCCVVVFLLLLSSVQLYVFLHLSFNFKENWNWKMKKYNFFFWLIFIDRLKVIAMISF